METVQEEANQAAGEDQPIKTATNLSTMTEKIDDEVNNGSGLSQLQVQSKSILEKILTLKDVLNFETSKQQQEEEIKGKSSTNVAKTSNNNKKKQLSSINNQKNNNNNDNKMICVKDTKSENCCQLRIELLSAIHFLCEKYAQVRHEVKKLLTGTNLHELQLLETSANMCKLNLQESSDAHAQMLKKKNNKQMRRQRHYERQRREQQQQPSTTTTTISKKQQKRSGKKRTNGKNANEKLTNYLNTIVKQYNNDSTSNENLFFIDGMNLLEYAEKLVNAGLGRIIVAPIRINRRNNQQAFLTTSNNDAATLERDSIILHHVARQYALDGDIVRAFVTQAHTQKQKPNDNDNDVDVDNDNDAKITVTNDIIDEKNCSKAFVIELIDMKHSRQIVGYINFSQLINMRNIQYYQLKPIDMRIPLIYIDMNDVYLKEMPELVRRKSIDYIFQAEIQHADAYENLCGKLIKMFGEAGELHAEIKGIVEENNLQHINEYDVDYNDNIALQLQQPTINCTRENLTDKCIFTIDPLTARDLDDALSIEPVADNAELFEIGVHISDVAHYLLEKTELDDIVKKRCTSIYLIHKAIHMLPPALCTHCSLLPNQLKYTFSVFWRITCHGDIVNEPRFVRTVIRSCAQLAYEHAQHIIDNNCSNMENLNNFPKIFNNFQLSDIVERIRNLHLIAEILRKKRFEIGALTINNPKINFNFDADTLQPHSYYVEERKSANFMIEEFMLLANQTVARAIYKRFPDTAILRNHGPPLQRCLRTVNERLIQLGINVDYTTSKGIQQSLERICRQSADPIAMDTFLSSLLMKPMARAKYFCSAGKSEHELWHYALSIPIYTHFTSPIRRYPDILVHRLLASCLNYNPPPQRSPKELNEIVNECNIQHLNAKNASDESSQLFFKSYVQKEGKVVMRAVVMEITMNMMSVVTIETGLTVGITYTSNFTVENNSSSPKSLELLVSNDKAGPALRLKVSSSVDIELSVKRDRLVGSLVLPDLPQEQ